MSGEEAFAQALGARIASHSAGIPFAAAVVVCAIAGTFVRILLDVGNSASGGPAASAFLYTDLWANVIGSLAMGALHHYHPDEHAIWYSALCKGFCGCLTTFASYEVAVANAILSCSGGCFVSIWGGLYSLVASWSVCLGAFEAGLWVTPLVEKWCCRFWQNEMSLSVKIRTHTDFRPAFAMSAAAILLIVCSVWMGLSVERIVPYPLQLSAIPMSLLFTPPAALLRIYTGLAFPGGPGTIACNLASTAIRAGCEYAWRAVGEPGGPSITVDGNVHAVFVSAVASGLCGSLSTVSSVLSELKATRSAQGRVIYGTATVLAGLLVSLVILGPGARSVTL